MENIIEIEHLRKSFGSIKAVDDLSFSVKKGELFAFLGVNGAGKSTTISIICGQLKKDGGSVTVCGENTDNAAERILSKIGVVFQGSVLDKALYGINGDSFKKRLFELSETLDFTDLLNRSVGKLSGGQRRRIDVARALLHKPEILILDEPTTGLDPQTRVTLWRAIENLRKTENMTVFLTTHYMEEAADADYVVILDSGKISACGTPIELKNKYTGDFITLYGDAYRVAVPDTAAATALIVKRPEIFRDYEITKGKMDDVFLTVTGKKLTGDENK